MTLAEQSMKEKDVVILCGVGSRVLWNHMSMQIDSSTFACREFGASNVMSERWHTVLFVA